MSFKYFFRNVPDVCTTDAVVVAPSTIANKFMTGSNSREYDKETKYFFFIIMNNYRYEHRDSYLYNAKEDR